MYPCLMARSLWTHHRKHRVRLTKSWLRLMTLSLLEFSPRLAIMRMMNHSAGKDDHITPSQILRFLNVILLVEMIAFL